MLTAWKEMKDREAFIREELRLFGNSEMLEMLADLYNMDDLEDFPIGLKPEELKERLKGYLTEDTAANSDSDAKPHDTDIPKPFRRLLEDLGLYPA